MWKQQESQWKQMTIKNKQSDQQVGLGTALAKFYFSKITSNRTYNTITVHSQKSNTKMSATRGSMIQAMSINTVFQSIWYGAIIVLIGTLWSISRLDVVSPAVDCVLHCDNFAAVSYYM